MAQLVAGKATRDALFLTHFGIGRLPAAMIAAALLSALSVILMSRVLISAGPARVVPATFALSAVLFLCEWALSLASEHATAIAVYAHTAIFSTAIGSAFWSLVNERFDPHEAKRLVGRIASGGTIGGVIGGLIVWRASAHLSVPMMLAFLAGINVIGLWGALKTAPTEIARPSKVSKAPPPPAAMSRRGLGVLGDTPYLRDLALLVGTGAIIQALLDWLLSAQASAEYPQGPRLLGFFAFFNMIVGVLAFAAQTLLTRVVLEKRGLGGTIKLQPMSVAVGVVAALVAPVFTTIVVLRIIEGVTRSSLYRSAYELFYTPLPAIKKRATKTLIDVGVDRIGTTLGSGVLLAVALLPSDTMRIRAVLFGVLAMCAIAWLLAARLQDGYVNALASSLKSGAVELDDEDAEDLTTKKTLAETTALLDRDKLLARIEQFQRQKELRSSEGGVRAGTGTGRAPTLNPLNVSGERIPFTTGEMGAFIDPSDAIIARAAALRSSDPAAIKAALASSLTPTLASLAIPLLGNDAVVREVVRALRKVAPKTTGMLLDHLLDLDVDPRVRRRIPRVLKVVKTQRCASGLALALRDPVFEVRTQVAIALSQMVDAEPTIKLDRDAVLDVALYELTTGRATWSVAKVGISLDHDPDASEEEGAEAAAGAPKSETEAASSKRRDTMPAKSHAQATEDEQDELRRGLAHVFGVLGLVLEREPLAIAYRALRAEDPALRGTAFEYLEVILPAHLREVIIPLLGDVKPPPRGEAKRERGPKELANELLRSRA